MKRERRRLAGAAGALLLLATACSDATDGPGDEPSTSESASTPTGPSDKPSETPSPTASDAAEDPFEIPTNDPDPGARISIQAERPASAFTSGLDRFLAGLRSVYADGEAPGSEDEMVAAGQGACSAISSGGAVASKLDFWGGQQGHAEGWNVPIVGAILVLCPEYQEGYLADRTYDITPSEPEKADLARFVIRRSLGNDSYDATPDRVLAREAARTCRRAVEDPGAFAGLDPVGDREEVAVLLAHVLAYCPDAMEALGLG